MVHMTHGNAHWRTQWINRNIRDGAASTTEIRVIHHESIIPEIRVLVVHLISMWRYVVHWELILTVTNSTLRLSHRRVARTCQIFQEPAFSHLWYDLNHLPFLKKCTPQDLWELKRKPVNAGLVCPSTIRCLGLY
jgi:hypothetical protein